MQLFFNVFKLLSKLCKNFVFGNKIHLSINITDLVSLVFFLRFFASIQSLYLNCTFIHSFCFSDFELAPYESTQAKQFVRTNEISVKLNFVIRSLVIRDNCMYILLLMCTLMTLTIRAE